MTDIRNWFLDFDETLATSPLTWALDDAFPRLIREHDLTCEPGRLESAVLVAQERSNREYDPEPILDELFETMDWPAALAQSLLQDVLTNYRPALFDDVVPFLRRLRAADRRVFVISNNPLSLGLLAALEIEGYVADIYTPRKHPGAQPKPHRALWDVILACDGAVDEKNSAMVGDDPWSDGRFAEQCGLPCWIVDRKGRFGQMQAEWPYRWVRSLLDIPLEPDPSLP